MIEPFFMGDTAFSGMCSWLFIKYAFPAVSVCHGTQQLAYQELGMLCSVLMC